MKPIYQTGLIGFGFEKKNELSKETELILAIKRTIRVIIVDNYRFFREALSQILKNQPDIEVVGEACDGLDALDMIRKTSADVVILEPLIPKKDGIDMTRDIVAMERNIQVLVLTMDTTDHNAFRMLRAGATGWLPKTVGSDELLQAIHTVADGKVYLPERLQRVFAERYVRPESIGQPEENLSDREFQVMRLLASGKTNREISELLFIGVKTVDTHRANLLRKLSLRNNSDITRFAIRNGFISF